MRIGKALLVVGSVCWASCSDREEIVVDQQDTMVYTAVEEIFMGVIDLDNPFDYEGQAIPAYISEDNTADNEITNEGATLGRVLFYDKNLSVDNTISCAGCHQQVNAFGDTELLSSGVSGNTGRHSMRLINSRFAEEDRFFWDERAATLEEQVTMPIQDHIEMGFSGADGDPDMADLIAKLDTITYYKELFHYAFGDDEITEKRMQDALAQFVRSIQSFDSKFDEGRSQVNNNRQDFPNFTSQENLGKQLFLDAPRDGGAGCGGCHRAPEFDIDPESLNNGVIGVAGGDAQDLNNTRAPSLRDIFRGDGTLNGPLMHDGSMATMLAVVDHYDRITERNDNLDPRLMGRGGLQNLNLTDTEKEAIVVFIKTLTGNEVYTADRYSNPFSE